MSIEQYIPDIDELISSFEAAGYVKEASEFKAIFAGLRPTVSRTYTTPRVKDPVEVAPTDTNKSFLEPEEEVTELTPGGEVAGRGGMLRPSFNAKMSPKEYQSVQHYIETQSERGLDDVDYIRQKIINEQKKYKENPNYRGESLSYLNGQLGAARARAEAIRKPVETFKNLRQTLGVNMPDDMYRGDVIQKLTAEYVEPRTDAKRRGMIGQFLKLSDMFKATAMGMLDADQIEHTYLSAMSMQATPEQYKKQLDQLAHLWTHRAAARRLVLAAAHLENFGFKEEASRLKIAAQTLVKNV